MVLFLTLAIVAQAADAARVPALKKGVVNTVKSMTTLVGSLTVPILKLDNNGAGPALQLEAGAGNAPLVVNADSGKATNLGADELDGKDSGEFAAKASEGWHENINYQGFLWTNFGTPHNTVGFYKDSVGIVHLKGVVRWHAPGGSALGGGCCPVPSWKSTQILPPPTR